MGLGDLIEKITTFTGIKWLVKKTTKMFGINDCGCDSRKKRLNKFKINRLDRWKN